ncbi:Hsp20/alpha crystallin family protein [Bifidobacterium aquikefiricola]|uniref:Hsp20/alpha crystallin family protein n=1 Tax=Bifidobacterium aquikefiricola TaxID=3059038 RepID=A0AB39U7W8_9BIFI
MAMFPALMNDSIFSDLFDDPIFSAWNGNRTANSVVPEGMSNATMMSTDVQDKDGNYLVDIDLPGFKKEDISIQLENGYLTVSAKREGSKEDKDTDGKWLRRERYAGSCSRNFYIGDGVKESDIHAKFEDGTLHLEVPKAQTPKVEPRHNIAIEG